LQTPLLRNASAHHLRTVNGLGMLVHQAIPGFSAWFGMTPTADEETLALLAANIPMSQ
jgi:shikimate dehydrogenase